MRRASDISTLTIDVSPRDRLVLDDMRRAGGYTSDANLVRGALYQHARHLDVRIDCHVFPQRTTRGHSAPGCSRPQGSSDRMPAQEARDERR